ncbi:MAG TPA: tetratricopeptide repeat protein [Polyangiaceae bacterium]|nr:tetratricopeptide repeat protein [Polyangiaceae bacterium]
MAFAQAGDGQALAPGERQRARALFRSAEALMVAGRWGEALRILSDLLALKETAALRYNRGVCHAKLGRWVAAYEDYSRSLALSMGVEGADLDYVADASRRGLRDAARYVAEVEVSVRPVPRGVHPTLLIDGVAHGAEREAGYQDGQLTWGPFVVARGEHSLEVKLEGRAPLRHTLRLAEASASDRDLTALVQLAWPDESTRQPGQASAPAAPAPTRPSSALPPIVGGIGLGVAACSAGLFVAHWARDRDEGGGAPYLPAALVTGAAALGAGAFALAYAAVSPGGAPDAMASSRKAEAGRPAVVSRVLVAPDRQGVGVVWSGAFW